MIREAENKDVDKLVMWVNNLLIHVQKSSKDVYTNNISDDFKATFPLWFINSIDSPDKIILIAEDKDIDVGFIMGSITKPYIPYCKIINIGQIDVCWVEESYRKKGIMTALVYEVENWFKARQIEYIDVAYLNGNIEAEQTWKHLNYKSYRIFGRKKI
jgi:GNAT superfamily N-acetyltransferase